MPTLVLEVTREENKLKVSAYEKGVAAEHSLRHYEESAVSFSEIESLCSQITALLSNANKTGELTTGPSEELRKTSQLLFDEIFPSEIKSRLRGSQCQFLIFSIDEQLVQIPWELLHDGTAFLSLRFACGRIVRTRQKFVPPKLRSSSMTGEMLIIADPTGDLDSAYQEAVCIRNSLEKNVKNIKVHLKTTNIDGQFLKKNIRDYDVVHFAGHADYNPNNPSDSGWILKDQKITARDIANLGESPRFPVIVFSNACQSGATNEWCLKEKYSEEIYGLANAFLLAGAKHYIGTFWKIIDEPSAYFSQQFYEAIFKNIAIGEAVRLARLKLVEKYGPKTVVWASYMLYGDPSAALSNYSLIPDGKGAFRRKGLRKAWLLGGVACLLLLAGLPFLSSKKNINPLEAIELSQAPKDTLAIMPFTNLNKDKESDWLSQGLAGGVAAKLFVTSEINVIDRADIENKWKEMNPNSDQELDLGSAEKIAKVFGANWILVGDYQKVGDALRVSARLVKVLSGEKMEVLQTTGSIKELFLTQDKAAIAVLEKIKLKISDDDKKRIRELAPPGNMTAFEYLAKASKAFYGNDQEAAIKYCNDALAIATNYYEAVNALGSIYERGGNLALAQQQYARALEIAKKGNNRAQIMVAYLTLGNATLLMEKPDQAVEYLNHAYEIARAEKDFRTEANILISLGRGALMKKDKATAVKLFEKCGKIAIALQNKSLQAYVSFTYGGMYLESLDPQDWRKALEDYGKARDFYTLANNKHDLMITYQQIALLESMCNQLDKAMEAASHALEFNKEIQNKFTNAALYAILGDIYRKKYEFGNAIGFFEKSLKVFESELNDWGQTRFISSQLFFLYLQQGNFQEANRCIKAVEDGAKKRNDYDALCFALQQEAMVLQQSGLSEKAEEKYRECLSFEGKVIAKDNMIDVYKGLGVVYGDLKKYEESRSFFIKALQLAKEARKEGIFALNIDIDFARVLKKAGNYEEAIKRCEDGIAILEKQPIEFRNSDSLVSAYFEVGDAYLSRGDYSQAKIFLDKAIAVAQKIKSPLLYELENERKKLG